MRDYLWKRLTTFFGNYLWAIWAWVIGNHQVPGWAIIFFIIFALAALFFILAGVLSGGPEYYKFNEALYEGARWRWRWFDRTIIDLCAYCPTCDLELVSNGSAYRTHTEFICENCKEPIAFLPGNMTDIRRRVEREIRRKVRTGEYKKS